MPQLIKLPATEAPANSRQEYSFSLTELYIARRAVEGWSDTEIAKSFFTTGPTIQSVLEYIMRKAGASSREELVLLARDAQSSQDGATTSPFAATPLLMVVESWRLSYKATEVFDQFISTRASNRQIAETLHTTQQVVKNYFQNIFEKSGAHSRMELIVAVEKKCNPSTQTPPAPSTSWRLATRLTERENTILPLLADGKKNKEISVALGITEQSVKNDVRSIADKFGADDRAHIAVIFNRYLRAAFEKAAAEAARPQQPQQKMRPVLVAGLVRYIVDKRASTDTPTPPAP